MVLPGLDLSLHSRYLGDPAIETLPFQHAEFYLRHIEPATMFGSVMNLKPFRQTPGFFRFESFVE